MMEEAQAREAVATFVLGLVAESVPVKSINQPSGDRLAEVKGRQVLDKFNCNGFGAQSAMIQVMRRLAGRSRQLVPQTAVLGIALRRAW